MGRRWKLFTSLAAAKLLAALLFALAAFPPFTVHPGKTDADGLPMTSATLCVTGEEPCFPLSRFKPADSPVEYFFALKPASEPIQLDSGGSLVLFWGTYTAGGSGILTRLALLEYGEGGRMVDLLPDVFITEQGERKIWKLPEISNLPVLVTADANWNPTEGESHFSPHLFTVWGYCFDAKTGKYARRLQYVTSKKYPSLDDVDSISVLEPERETILQKLKAGSPR